MFNSYVSDILVEKLTQLVYRCYFYHRAAEIFGLVVGVTVYISDQFCAVSEIERMPAKSIASDRQLEILLAFMEQNPDIANANPTNYTDRKQLAEVWDGLTKRLNANAESTGGCKKTQRQWRDYWHCKKYVLNKKRMIARQQRRATSGNPAPLPKVILFTEWEARIARILTSRQSSQVKAIEPTEEILTSVKHDHNTYIQETEEEVDIPNEEVNSNSASTSALLTEDVKIEFRAYSPAQASSPEASSPPISPSPDTIFTAKIAAAPRPFKCVKRPYYRLGPTAEEIKLAAEDKKLAKEERRIAEKERRMAAEDRRLAAEDRRLAAEDRQLAIVERKIAVQERRLAEEARRKASEDKITKTLQTMSQKLTRLSAELDNRPP